MKKGNSMKIRLTSIEEKIQRSFQYVMFDKSFNINKNKRFRIFFFAYMFGCISVSTLNIIFADIVQYRYTDNTVFQNNTNRSILSYLCKKGLLSKVSKDYYTVTLRSVNLLFELLKKLEFLNEDEHDSFLKYTCKITTHVNHAVKNGEAVLSFLQDSKFLFITEPYIDEAGNRIFPSFNESNQYTIIPDSILYTQYENEYIFLEADSCEERISSGLIPKFDRYCKNILSNADSSSHITILFSVWSKTDIDHMLLDQKNFICNLYDFFSFIQRISGPDTSFQTYIKELQTYKGNNSTLNNLSIFVQQFLPHLDYEPDSIKKLYDSYIFNSHYSKTILSRRNSLIKCVSLSPCLLNALHAGLRLVCLPNSAGNMYYKYTFFDFFSNEKYAISYINKTFPNCAKLGFYKVREFLDISNGDKYAFRNVYEVLYLGEKIYLIFENICDDIGGYFRIKRYMHRHFIRTIESLRFFCLFNDFIIDNPLSYFSVGNDTKDNLCFISYCDFFIS